MGWTREELHARPFIDFVHADDREATLTEFRRLSRGAAPELFENRYLDKDGDYTRIEISLRHRRQEGRLSIRDNGAGFSSHNLAQEGIGMHTMHYRARPIGASLQVRRRAPRGVAISCAFPLAHPVKG